MSFPKDSILTSSPVIIAFLCSTRDGCPSEARRALQTASLCSRAAPPGLSVLRDQLFQDARRCHVLSLKPQLLLSVLPDVCGSHAGRNPDGPALGES